MSIYEQIGGATAIRAAVGIFYDRVTVDPLLAPYFAGVDLQRLEAHQRAFLSAAFGGPETFTGRSLHDAHASLAITDEVFDATIETLILTLVDLGVADDALPVVRERLEAARSEIVTSS